MIHSVRYIVDKRKDNDYHRRAWVAYLSNDTILSCLLSCHEYQHERPTSQANSILCDFPIAVVFSTWVTSKCRSIKNIIVCLLVLLTVFLSSRSLVGTQEYGNAKVDERCERDRNCIQHAFCLTHRTCQCDQYYSPTPDKSMCIASEYRFVKSRVLTTLYMFNDLFVDLG